MYNESTYIDIVWLFQASLNLLIAKVIYSTRQDFLEMKILARHFCPRQNLELNQHPNQIASCSMVVGRQQDMLVLVLPYTMGHMVGPLVLLALALVLVLAWALAWLGHMVEHMVVVEHIPRRVAGSGQQLVVVRALEELAWLEPEELGDGSCGGGHG